MTTTLTASQSTDTAFEALLLGLADPALPLEVSLVDDDGFALAEIEVTVGEHLLTMTADVQILDAAGLVEVGQPTLRGTTLQALDRAGLLPAGTGSAAARERRARLELGVLMAQGKRIKTALLAARNG